MDGPHLNEIFPVAPEFEFRGSSASLRQESRRLWVQVDCDDGKQGDPLNHTNRHETEGPGSSCLGEFVDRFWVVIGNSFLR